ncbi:uncharacterized protein LOC130635980 isoform X2 [Hydractinia symbiolongicarpus]|nr:uncharacterized protein LOC130635980 isoform X2 [Hydractinia symbiolongicarpus]
MYIIVCFIISTANQYACERTSAIASTRGSLSHTISTILPTQTSATLSSVNSHFSLPTQNETNGRHGLLPSTKRLIIVFGTASGIGVIMFLSFLMALTLRNLHR